MRNCLAQGQKDRFLPKPRHIKVNHSSSVINNDQDGWSNPKGQTYQSVKSLWSTWTRFTLQHSFHHKALFTRQHCTQSIQIKGCFRCCGIAKPTGGTWGNGVCGGGGTKPPCQQTGRADCEGMVNLRSWSTFNCLPERIKGVREKHKQTKDKGQQF